MKLSERSRDLTLQALVNERVRWHEYADSLPKHDPEHQRARQIACELETASREFRDAGI